MTAKSMVRFYAVIFNKIGALLNEIHADIRSKSEAHKLIKTGFRSIGPAPAFYAITSCIFLYFSAAPGLFCFLKGESVRIASKESKLP